MFRFLKRWLGWEEDLDYFDPDDFKPVPRTRPVTSTVLAPKPRKPAPVPRTPPRQAPPADDAEPLEPDFNPYNTGKFDRSASWERISKNSR